MNFSMVGNVVLLKLSETVGFDETEKFKSNIKSLIDEDYLFFAVDMAEVDCITSSGLGVIFAAHKELRMKGGKIVLFGLPPHVAKAIQDWRLDRFIPIYQTQAEACSALEQFAHSGTH